MNGYQSCTGCGAHVPSGEKLCLPCTMGEEMNLQGYPKRGYGHGFSDLGRVLVDITKDNPPPKPHWLDRPPDGSGPGWEHVTYDRPQGWKGHWSEEDSKE